MEVSSGGALPPVIAVGVVGALGAVNGDACRARGQVAIALPHRSAGRKPRRKQGTRVRGPCSCASCTGRKRRRRLDVWQSWSRPRSCYPRQRSRHPWGGWDEEALARLGLKAVPLGRRQARREEACKEVEREERREATTGPTSIDLERWSKVKSHRARLEVRASACLDRHCQLHSSLASRSAVPYRH